MNSKKNICSKTRRQERDWKTKDEVAKEFGSRQQKNRGKKLELTGLETGINGKRF